MRLNIPKRTLNRAIADGAIFYVSHSGGKDSQTMYWYLRRIGVPDDQIVVVHANLGRVEHEGVISHIEATIAHELHIVRAVDKTGARYDLIDRVRRNAEKRPDAPPWPSSAARWCTSDLKRGPIEKFIRQDMKARGVTKAVNCIGLRAAESATRAKRNPWTENTRLSKAGRQVADWLPIHHVSDQQLRTWAHEVGDWHPMYRQGNDRLSCAFCIFGCQGDLKNAAQAYPELYQEYLQVERETGYTMFQGESLAQKAGLVDYQGDSTEPHQEDLF